MKRGVLHIVFGLACATPAVALTPVPMCSIAASLEGSYNVWNAQDAGNGYVTYRGEEDTSDKALVVLEHCKTGRSVVAKAVWDGDEATAHYVDNVSDAMDDYIYTATSYSLSQIAAGLKGRGITASVRTLKDESCGCSVFYPEVRGNRKPYD